MEQEHKWLEFTIKVLQAVNMWPGKKSEKNGFISLIKQYYIISIIFVTSLPIVAEFVSWFYEEEIYISYMIESLIAISALYGVIYVFVCFTVKKHEIRTLVEDLSVFQKFCPLTEILKTEEAIKFYTHFFVTYGTIGNVVYGLIPFLSLKQCNANRKNNEHMLKYKIPCGLVTNFILPFDYETTPMREIVAVEEILVCSLGTAIVIMLTMLVCGILMHITAQFGYLEECVEGLSILDAESLRRRVNFCIEFHTALTEYATKTMKCFNSMMLLHITWTGVIISILGYELTIVDNYLDTIRYIMHLLGWLGMLFLVCYYGQALKDKSSTISEAVYAIKWYDMSPTIRTDLCLIILRGHRPSLLKAGGLRVMSLETFLNVLYSAYSYFTLLLKMKDDSANL